MKTLFVSLKSDYVEYALQAVFSILAVTSIYFVEPSKPSTFIYIVTVPLLFSYTAYISSQSFQRSTFVSLITVFFIPLGPIYALASVFVISCNLSVSYLSRGETFRDFYSSITLPLLLSGLILGLSVFTVLSFQPENTQKVSEEASKILSDQTDQMSQRLGINSSEAQTKLLKTVSTLTVSMTQAQVIESTSGQLSPRDLQNVSNAFNQAKEDVPSRIVERASSQTPETQEILSNALSNILGGSLLFIVIPLIAGLTYAFNPILGLSMGVIGVMIRRIDSYFSETP